MTTQPHPTARELAKKCANLCVVNTINDKVRMAPEIIAETILRELNLEELLRDRERSVAIFKRFIQEMDHDPTNGVRFTVGDLGVELEDEMRQIVDSTIASQRKEGK